MPLVNLNRKLSSFDRSGVRVRKTRVGSFPWKKLVIIIAVLLVAFYLPARGVYSAAKDISKNGKQISQGFKQNDLELIKKGVVDTKSSVEALDGSLNWFMWLRVIPFLGGFYGDAKSFASAASEEMKAAEIIVNSLDPYKQELNLNGQPIAGQDQLAQGIKILDKVLPNMDKVIPSLKKAGDEVEGIDPGKYPEKFGNTRIRDRVSQLKDFIMVAAVAVDEHRDALEVAPDALGQTSPKTYLILFQNDKEIRPTGGFITAYTFLTLDKGHISTSVSDDIYRLDERLLATCESKICPLTPPAPIVKYLPEVTGKPRSAWSMRDSNISPDLPTAASEFERMYSLLGGGLPFDGIITIDTQVVEELIAITGPVEVYGTNYSAEKDPRCNCPNVVYELEHYAEVAAKGEQDRKAVLGTLMQQVLGRALGSGVDKVPDFLTSGVRLANDKHIMFFMHNLRTQAAMSKLNWTGQIQAFEGDYLHINDANFAGGKSNLYVEEKVVYEIKVDSSGNVSNKVTIEYKNPQPFNTWLNGILRDYVRVYVPKGSKLVSSKGSDDPVNTLEDEKLGKTYFDAFIQVRPQNSRTLSFEYTSSVKAQGKSLPLLIQKQPGAKDHHYIVKVNGSTKAEFDLTSDKEFNLNF